MLKQQRLTMVCALLLLCSQAPNAWPETTFKTLLKFDGTNGSAPSNVQLVQGTDGNLYGTTFSGGKNDAGTVFKMTTAGKLTTLYSFCSKANCADGSNPEVGLLLATNGDFYGSTAFGGVDCPLFGSLGCGTVFEITPEGKLTTLYTFCEKGGECSDGANPEAPLIEGTNGDFYGTTNVGGNSNNAGTLFEITPAGKLITLYTFCSEDGIYCHDGANPEGPMVWVPADAADTDGAYLDGQIINTPPQLSAPYLWGADPHGGGVHYEGSPCGDGMIWVYDQGAGAEKYQGIYWLCEEEKPADPNFVFGLLLPLGFLTDKPLTTSPSRVYTLFGTGDGGGTNGYGGVYSITTAKKFTVLYDFCSKAKCADGASPNPLAEGTDGNLYGTTVQGGSTNSKCPPAFNNTCGTVFEITPEGALTTLHSFKGSDGETPYSTLVQATNGIFYGTTFSGGTTGDGTIFSVSTGLGPFVQTVPTMGAVGSSVMILGTDLTGATFREL